MSDAQDQIARLAAEAQQRADVAGTQAAWQEGRAHGLREAAAAIATATDTRTLRDDIRDYIADLTARGAPPSKQPGHRLLLLSPSQLARRGRRRGEARHVAAGCRGPARASRRQRARGG